MSFEEDTERLSSFQRNADLEKLLHDINSLLAPAEQAALAQYENQETAYPIIFIMGPFRSGTTLLMQWLANMGVVAYPTNLLSRFYGAPVMGALIQMLLADPRFNFRNEILDFNSSIPFESENGKTRGALAPNEFWYFWRRFLPFGKLDWLPDEELFRVVDQKRLVGELTTLTRIFAKPFALKGLILNYNIPFLDTIFKKALFVQVKRNPADNVASVLEARKRQFGTEKQWYSFRIPEYPLLKALDPVTQCAGQVYYINKAVTKGMAAVAESRKMAVEYEAFCDRPEDVYNTLTEKLNNFGCVTDKAYQPDCRFEPTRQASMDGDIHRALQTFEGK